MDAGVRFGDIGIREGGHVIHLMAGSKRFGLDAAVCGECIRSDMVNVIRGPYRQCRPCFGLKKKRDKPTAPTTPPDPSAAPGTPRGRTV